MKWLKIFINYIVQRLSIIRGEVHRNDRYGALVRAWGHVYTNHLFGDYVEFGVYRGDSIVSSLKIRNDFNLWLKSEYSGVG